MRRRRDGAGRRAAGEPDAGAPDPGPTDPSAHRAQSSVVGVALLVGVVAIAIAATTAGVGTMVQSGADAAAVDRVARDLSAAFAPGEGRGTDEGTVRLAAGELTTVDRQVRLRAGRETVATVDADALRYRHAGSDRRVTLQLGGVVVDTGTDVQRYRPPAIALAGAGEDALLAVGVVDVSGDPSVETAGPSTVSLRTNVTHERRTVRGVDALAVETATPAAWTELFERRDATAVGIEDLDGDGIPSAVARFERRRVELVIHRTAVTVDG